MTNKNEVINEVYKDTTDVYLKMVDYKSWNDIHHINDIHDSMFNKKHFRRKVFKLLKVYFDEKLAIIIYNDIKEYYKENRKKDSTITLRSCLNDWKEKYLDVYTMLAGEQQLDVDDFKKHVRKSFFKKFFH